MTIYSVKPSSCLTCREHVIFIFKASSIIHLNKTGITEAHSFTEVHTEQRVKGHTHFPTRHLPGTSTFMFPKQTSEKTQGSGGTGVRRHRGQGVASVLSADEVGFIDKNKKARTG